MRYVDCEVNDEYVTGSGVVIGAEGSHNDVALRLVFGDMWIGLNIYATFTDAQGSASAVVLLTPSMLEEGKSMTYVVPIPADAKRYAGKSMLTLSGYAMVNGSQVDRATNTVTSFFRVLKSDYRLLTDNSITPSLAQQLHAEVVAFEENVAEQIETIEEATNAVMTEVDGVAAAAGGAVEAANVAMTKVEGAVEEAREAVETANSAKNESANANSKAASAKAMVDQLRAEADSGAFKGEKGDPFTVSKVYTSVAEMEADFDNDAVPEGAFVVIETGNVEDAENARLYIKGAEGFSFVTDLSGAKGMKGEPGKTPVNGVDYNTPTDKAAIVQAVLDALPTWEGGSY